MTVTDTSESTTVQDEQQQLNAQSASTNATVSDQGERSTPISAIWDYERSFANQESLEQFLEQEECWAKLKTETLVKGIKTSYRCSNVKRRGKQCAAAIYTLKAQNEIKLFRRQVSHDCDGSENKKKPKVSEEIRKYILDQHKLGNPPATIIFRLREMTDIDQPTSQQVTHILSYYKEKMPNSAVSIADMEKFVNEHNMVPEDDDTPFVVNFMCSPPQALSNEKFFRMFFSTKRLLKYALLSKILHADGTYQILVQGYPVLVVGISDADKHFHLNGLAITSSEAAEDYKFLFDSLKLGVKLVTNEDVQVDQLVADMAPAITEGFVRSFEDAPFTRVHCFMHIMSNVEKQKFNSSDNKEAIKSDIRCLQLIHDKDLFDLGWKLLAEKWADREPEFIAYFEKVYINSNSNWYEGVSDRTPKTNNCLEVFNRLMKQQQTMNLRLPLNQFLPKALLIVRERSKAYVQDKKPPTTSVTVTDELKLKAWYYSESKKHARFQSSANGVSLFYVFAGDKMEKVTGDDVLNWENSSYKDFEDFVAKTASMYRISFDGSVADLDRGKCTCVSYAKNNMCKHILAMAYRMEALDPPDDLLKTVETPAPVKNKRGRPKKTTKALIV